MREKFEISLDGPQVASIVVGALVILGGVFVLGLNVGKQLAAHQPRPVAAPADPLAALDVPAPVDLKDPGPKLSYHEELTREEPRPKPTPLQAAPAKTAEPAKPSVPSLPPPSGESAEKPRPKPEPRSLPEPKTESELASEPSPEPKVAPAKRAPADAEPSPTRSEGAFAIQVGASQSFDEAGRISDQFKPYRPKIVASDVPGKGRWYRVRLGAFETREEANRYLADLSRETGATGFVTATSAPQ